MKRIQTANLPGQVLIPVIAYLLTGLILIKFGNISVDSTYFVIWGIMAGIVLGIKTCFDNKTVTVGMEIYILAVVMWFGLFAGRDNRIHAVLAALGVVVIIFFQFLFRYKIIKVLMLQPSHKLLKLP